MTFNKIKFNYKQPKRVGWTPILLLICVATTIGAVIPVGYALGVMNTPAEVGKCLLFTFHKLTFKPMHVSPMP